MDVFEPYLQQLQPDKFEPTKKLLETVHQNLPPDFERLIQYKMPSFSVPKSIYPPGYHCDTNLPLPFISVGAQKNHIALYHCGIYAMPEVLNWFKEEYPKHSKKKLDMGKSCIRFKAPYDIPYNLIAELVSKISCTEWIEAYEKAIKK